MEIKFQENSFQIGQILQDGYVVQIDVTGTYISFIVPVFRIRIIRIHFMKRWSGSG